MEQTLAYILYGILAALILYNIKEFIFKKKSDDRNNRSEFSFKQDNFLKKKRNEIAIKIKDEFKTQRPSKKFDINDNIDLDLLDEEIQQVDLSAPGLKKIGKIIRLLFFLYIAYTFFMPDVRKSPKKIINSQSQTRKAPRRLHPIHRQHEVMTNTTSKCCMVRQIVWENSNACFEGVKIYDQTKCVQWACDPVGSGEKREEKTICRKGHAGISTRYQYMDFNI